MAFTFATDLVPGCAIDQILVNESSLTIQAHSTAITASCPTCAQLSSSVHTYYTRSPQDLPIGAKIVRLQLRVRRFRCHNSSCAKRTFSERLPQLLQPYAQKTERFIIALYHTAQALGSAAAARLSLLLQLPQRHHLATNHSPLIFQFDSNASCCGALNCAFDYYRQLI